MERRAVNAAGHGQARTVLEGAQGAAAATADDAVDRAAVVATLRELDLDFGSERVGRRVTRKPAAVISRAAVVAAVAVAVAWVGIESRPEVPVMAATNIRAAEMTASAMAATVAVSLC